jgi:hypothetical protein
MYSIPYPHKIVLLRSGFQYPERHLFFARARLFFDRIELTGWHLGERHEEVIPLDAVERVEWQDSAAHPTVVLHLAGERRLTLSLGQAGQWKHALAQRLDWRESRSRFAPDPQAPSLVDLISYPGTLS